MRGLTLTQPWASLVALGAKRIETRSWITPYRGPIAIHAGKGLSPVGGRHGLFEQCYTPTFLTALEPAMTTTRKIADIEIPHINPDLLPRGVIVAVAHLHDVVPTDQMRRLPSEPSWSRFYYGGREWKLTDEERAFGDYTSGRYAWLLSDVRRLPTPVPCKGALRLWQVPAEVDAAIWSQL